MATLATGVVVLELALEGSLGSEFRGFTTWDDVGAITPHCQRKNEESSRTLAKLHEKIAVNMLCVCMPSMQVPAGISARGASRCLIPGRSLCLSINDSILLATMLFSSGPRVSSFW